MRRFRSGGSCRTDEERCQSIHAPRTAGAADHVVTKSGNEWWQKNESTSRQIGDEDMKRVQKAKQCTTKSAVGKHARRTS